MKIGEKDYYKKVFKITFFAITTTVLRYFSKKNIKWNTKELDHIPSLNFSFFHFAIYNWREYIYQLVCNTKQVFFNLFMEYYSCLWKTKYLRLRHFQSFLLYFSVGLNYLTICKKKLKYVTRRRRHKIKLTKFYN